MRAAASGSESDDFAPERDSPLSTESARACRRPGGPRGSRNRRHQRAPLSSRRFYLVRILINARPAVQDRTSTCWAASEVSALTYLIASSSPRLRPGAHLVPIFLLLRPGGLLTGTDLFRPGTGSPLFLALLPGTNLLHRGRSFFGLLSRLFLRQQIRYERPVLLGRTQGHKPAHLIKGFVILAQHRKSMKLTQTC